MNGKAVIAAFAFLLAAGAASAQEAAAEGRRAANPEKPGWEFAANGYWNAPRGGDGYASGIFAADRAALHLEARVNYEGRHARSAFAGWTFSGGDEVKFELTPIVGGAAGDVRGPIAGFEASVAAGRFDLYVEFEHVRDRTEGASTYNYAWSEVAFRPLERLRAGIVAQRTRVYGTDREIQRGPFAQATIGAFTLGAWWFNPGTTDQVFVASVGMTF